MSAKMYDDDNALRVDNSFSKPPENRVAVRERRSQVPGLEGRVEVNSPTDLQQLPKAGEIRQELPEEFHSALPSQVVVLTPLLRVNKGAVQIAMADKASCIREQSSPNSQSALRPRRRPACELRRVLQKPHRYTSPLPIITTTTPRFIVSRPLRPSTGRDRTGTDHHPPRGRRRTWHAYMLMGRLIRVALPFANTSRAPPLETSLWSSLDAGSPRRWTPPITEDAPRCGGIKNEQMGCNAVSEGDGSRRRDRRAYGRDRLMVEEGMPKHGSGRRCRHCRPLVEPPLPPSGSNCFAHDTHSKVAR